MTNTITKITYDGQDYIVGTGDVVGPASATDGHLAVFDQTTGKLIKDGGVVPTGVPAGGNNGDVLTNVSGAPCWAKPSGGKYWGPISILWGCCCSGNYNRPSGAVLAEINAPVSGDTKGNSYIQMNKMVPETIQGRGCCSSPAYTATNDGTSICIDKGYAPNYNIVFYGQMQGDIIHKFCVDTLIIGGGGGSQDYTRSGGSPLGSGGGGAGGFVEQTVEKEVLGSPYTAGVVVGAGGVKANGDNSSVFGLIAYGGGTGGLNSGTSGGSGGGGRNYGAVGCDGQGNAGGNWSGGGGGAGECGCPGSSYPESSNKKGGDGKCSCISGELKWYSGGGGGGIGSYGMFGGCGGCGGGGNGGETCTSCAPSNGNYYGGGGGGAGGVSGVGGSGGSCGYQGVVYIRYKTDGSCGITCAEGGNKYVCGDYTIHEFTTVGSTDFTIYF